jgi:PAS domain S-box-containing protein
MKSNVPKYWNAIIDISPVQFGVYDLVKHQRIFSSGLAEKALGYSSEELEEFSKDFYRDLILEEDYLCFEKSVEYLTESEDHSSAEVIFRVRTKSGYIIWVRTHQRVLERGPNGKPVKLISSSEDITELKIMEHELREEVNKLNAIPSENLKELRIQLNAVSNIMDLFRENHFSSEMDRRLWNYMTSSVKKMNHVVNGLW